MAVKAVGPVESFEITDSEFHLFKNLVYKLAGINLNDTKKMLLVSRFSKRLRVLGLVNFSEYYDYVSSGADGESELSELINLITTNKTDFFRENHHFEMLNGVILPDLAEKVRGDRNGNIRIWSAGCSTGEEPYTLAMVIDNFLQEKKLRLDIKILATDLDTNVLGTAMAGQYKLDRMVGIPEEYRGRYFDRSSEQQFSVKPILKQYIRFGRFNLTHPLPFKYGFDVIFCRNVLIYFTQDDRKTMVRKFHTVMRPGAWLALGHSESLVVEGLELENKGMTMYRNRRGENA